MKKWFSIIVICLLLLTGCTAEFDKANTAKSNENIQAYFIDIPNETNLYYAKDTGIVYWIGGSYTANFVGDDYTTSYMTPWYAPNGKPYRYNTAEKQMEPIV